MWAKYVSCLEGVLTKDANGSNFDESGAFAKCRHSYFKNWTVFQSTMALLTSTCVGSRFTDNGNGTVSDNLTGLVWEKKTTGGFVHDKDNVYVWGKGIPPFYGDGSAFATFLTGAGTGLNVAAFVGAQDWRLPTLAEVQTIVLDYHCAGGFGSSGCTCGTVPCLAFTDPNTHASKYWSGTQWGPNPNYAWTVSFLDGGVVHTDYTSFTEYVRAVRGGW